MHMRANNNMVILDLFLSEFSRMRGVCRGCHYKEKLLTTSKIALPSADASNANSFLAVFRRLATEASSSVPRPLHTTMTKHHHHHHNRDEDDDEVKW